MDYSGLELNKIVMDVKETSVVFNLDTLWSNSQLERNPVDGILMKQFYLSWYQNDLEK